METICRGYATNPTQELEVAYAVALAVVQYFRQALEDVYRATPPIQLSKNVHVNADLIEWTKKPFFVVGRLWTRLVAHTFSNIELSSTVMQFCNDVAF
jgi:hypothetical protein